MNIRNHFEIIVSSVDNDSEENVIAFLISHITSDDYVFLLFLCFYESNSVFRHTAGARPNIS